MNMRVEKDSPADVPILIRLPVSLPVSATAARAGNIGSRNERNRENHIIIKGNGNGIKCS